MKRKNILDVIGTEEAEAILKELVAADAEIRKRAEEIALNLVGDVDAEEVAEEVFWALDCIAVEDVWDTSGPTRHGYVDSGDRAWQLFEEALQPFRQELHKCQQLGLKRQAKLQCMGILTGIRHFETESESEFKDWTMDAPSEVFVSVYEDWRKVAKNKKDVAEVKRLIAEIAPEHTKYCK